MLDLNWVTAFKLKRIACQRAPVSGGWTEICGDVSRCVSPHLGLGECDGTVQGSVFLCSAHIVADPEVLETCGCIKQERIGVTTMNVSNFDENKIRKAKIRKRFKVFYVKKPPVFMCKMNDYCKICRVWSVTLAVRRLCSHLSVKLCNAFQIAKRSHPRVRVKRPSSAQGCAFTICCTPMG